MINVIQDKFIKTNSRTLSNSEELALQLSDKLRSRSVADVGFELEQES